MGKRKNKNKNLTQEEIWDDSALIQSWDEALEEYKLYHSIHAKGEDVEEVLRQTEIEDDSNNNEVATELTAETEVSSAPGNGNDIETNDYEMEEALKDGELHVESVTQRQSDPSKTTVQIDPDQVPSSAAMEPKTPAVTGPPAVPQHLLSSVQDEGLKNLMMAWYYAGYYTGLYEGQQQANQSAAP